MLEYEDLMEKRAALNKEARLDAAAKAVARDVLDRALKGVSEGKLIHLYSDKNSIAALNKSLRSPNWNDVALRGGQTVRVLQHNPADHHGAEVMQRFVRTALAKQIRQEGRTGLAAPMVDLDYAYRHAREEADALANNARREGVPKRGWRFDFSKMMRHTNFKLPPAYLPEKLLARVRKGLGYNVPNYENAIGVFRTSEPFISTTHVAHPDINARLSKGDTRDLGGRGHRGGPIQMKKITPDVTKPQVPLPTDETPIDYTPYFETVTQPGQRWDPISLYVADPAGKITMQDIRNGMRYGDVARGGDISKVLNFGILSDHYASLHPEQAPRWHTGVNRVHSKHGEGLDHLRYRQVQPTGEYNPETLSARVLRDPATQALPRLKAKLSKLAENEPISVDLVNQKTGVPLRTTFDIPFSMSNIMAAAHLPDPTVTPRGRLKLIGSPEAKAKAYKFYNLLAGLDGFAKLNPSSRVSRKIGDNIARIDTGYIRSLLPSGNSALMEYLSGGKLTNKQLRALARQHPEWFND